MRGQLQIIACESGRPFAEKVFNHLREKANTEGRQDFAKQVATQEKKFANTELKTRIEESIRGADVYIFQDVENSTNKYSVNDNHRALLTAIDAARRSTAGHISVVIPTFPYARQDKPFGREAITAAIVAKELEDAGAKTILTLDIHNNAIAGFFRIAVLENLFASKTILDFVRNNIPLDHLVIASPDEGGVKRASYYAEALKKKFVVCYKERDYSKENVVNGIGVLGDVRGQDVLIIDDMVDTAGTLECVVRALKEKGARRVYFACSLPLLNDSACDILKGLSDDGALDLFIGTDAVYHGENFAIDNPWFKEVSIAKYFAAVIRRLNLGWSVSSLVGEEDNQ